MSKSLRQSPAEYLTTGVVARYCGVSKVTVLRWIYRGHLAAFRLPEGHYRIHKNDFSKFLQKHDIPVRKQVFKGKRSGKTGARG